MARNFAVHDPWAEVVADKNPWNQKVGVGDSGWGAVLQPVIPTTLPSHGILSPHPDCTGPGRGSEGTVGLLEILDLGHLVF